MNMRRTVSDRSGKSRTGKGFTTGLSRWAGRGLGALAVSVVAIASVAAQAPNASAATTSPAPSWAAVAHTASGLSPAQQAAAGIPRGIVYPIGRAPRTPSVATSTNPNCPSCAPPLAFTANDPVAGGVSGTPGHVTITPIFWAPTGYSFPAGYNSTIDQYLADVAAASGTNGNVFSVAQEFYQQLGTNPKAFISYHVTAGTAVNATDAYPAQGGVSGCTAETGFGLTACVTDGALQTEVASVLSAHSLTANDSHIYMVFFPPNVQTCFGPGSPTTVGCSYSGSGSNGQYCGYHSSSFPGGNTALYANEPYVPLNGCWGFEAPNSAEADAEISIISHEANETITDYANAWRDAVGYEDGDECAYTYGVPLGGSYGSGTAYNQVINGHHYYTQDEFSNASYALNQGDITDVGGGGVQVNGCIQRANTTSTPPTVSAVSPNNGPVSGNTAITITGTGFVAGATVKVGQGAKPAVAATSVVVVSSTKITAVTGGGATAGTFNLFVTTSGGTSAAKSGDFYTYH
jgi:hypothetical protein